MSTQFAKLRKALVEKDWNAVVASFRKWPKGEERETALAYAETHLADWSIEERVAKKPDNHPCWSLVRHWQAGTLNESVLATLKTSSHLQMLTLTKKGFDQYHETLQTCSNLTHLQITGKLRDIDVEALAEFTHLRFLHFQQNKFSNLSFVRGLTQLEELRLGASYFLGDLEALRSLETLQVFACTNGTFASLEPLQNNLGMREIEVSQNNNLIDILALSAMTQLRKAKLEWLPALSSLDSLKTLENLEELCINGCTPVRDVKFLKRLTKLRILQASYLPNLKSLQGIENLTELRELDLSESQIDSTSRLKGMLKLKKLWLRGIKKNLEPENLLTLTQLEVLSLSHIKTCRRLPNFTPLQSLRILNISETSLTNLQFLRGLSSLDTLQAWRCLRLESLEGLEEASSLRILDLAGCSQITDFTQLQELQELESLQLRNHPHLESLDVVKPLKKLIFLLVEHCGTLQECELSFPAMKTLLFNDNHRATCLTLSNCSSLEKLYVQRCEKLEEIRRLSDTRLKELSLFHNPSLLRVEGYNELKSLKAKHVRIQGCPHLSTT